MRLLLASLLISYVLGGSFAQAEFSCAAEVSYKWKHDKGEEELEVFFVSRDKQGADEAKAKESLTEAINREKGRALAACRREHENETGCASGKFAASQSTLQALSFNARKSLESAILADCKTQQGHCISSQASEPVCKELAAKAAEPEAGKEAEKDKGGKDKKKK